MSKLGHKFQSVKSLSQQLLKLSNNLDMKLLLFSMFSACFGIHQTVSYLLRCLGCCKIDLKQIFIERLFTFFRSGMQLEAACSKLSNSEVSRTLAFFLLWRKTMKIIVVRKISHLSVSSVEMTSMVHHSRWFELRVSKTIGQGKTKSKAA